jgi:hypothetical protein
MYNSDIVLAILAANANSGKLVEKKASYDKRNIINAKLLK